MDEEVTGQNTNNHWIQIDDNTYYMNMNSHTYERHKTLTISVWLQKKYRANECDEKKRRYTSSSIKSPNWCLNQGTEEDRRARAALDQDQEGMRIKDIFVGFGERLRILS